jgi:hypothetical protein
VVADGGERVWGKGLALVSLVRVLLSLRFGVSGGGMGRCLL